MPYFDLPTSKNRIFYLLTICLLLVLVLEYDQTRWVANLTLTPLSKKKIIIYTKIIW